MWGDSPPIVPRRTTCPFLTWRSSGTLSGLHSVEATRSELVPRVDGSPGSPVLGVGVFPIPPESGGHRRCKVSSKGGLVCE